MIMILPTYKEETLEETKGYTLREITFDKVKVFIGAHSKHSNTDIKFHINPGYKRRNVDLSTYINALNDYLISHPFYAEYKGKIKNLFDFQYIKSLYFEGLKFNSNEFQIINHKYPNISSVTTDHCTIYENALIGCLKCRFKDYSSDIMSLDSFNGFSGEYILLNESKVAKMNKNVLTLLCDILEIKKVDLDYERFFLTTDAPKIRKLKILRTKTKELSSKDLLFISGFYNLESIEIDGIVENYNQIKKLERLHRIKYLLQTNQDELEKTKQKRMKVYQVLKEKGLSEQQLQDYIMYQFMEIQNRYLDFHNKLYIPRLERVKWENKISTKDLEKIKEELIQITNMSKKERKNISREVRKYTLFDSINDLWFDDIEEKEEEYILKNSRPPFDSHTNEGIEYYVKNKKIIIE